MHALTSLRFSLLATAAFTLPLAALAQDAGEIYTLDEIVVSGSLTPIAKSDTGATVETVDSDETGATAQSVSDVLSALPGVSMSRDGGVGASTTLRIRGLSSNYIGVRINGIDVTDVAGPQVQYDFGGLLSYGISSIEVLKGSQSALYGSEAIAGLVSIDTLSGEPGLSTTFEAGSYGTYSAGVSNKIESDTGSLAFTLSHFKTDGFSSQASNSEDDGFEETTLTFGLEQDVSDSITLGLTGLYRDSDLDYDAFDDVYATASHEEKGLRGYVRIAGDVVTHEISASMFNADRTYIADTNVWGGGFFPKDETDYTSRRKEFNYLGSTDLSALTTLTFGADYVEEKYSSASGAYGSSGGKNHTASLKGELLIEPTAGLNFSAALRYDDHSDFGEHISGRLAAAWEFAPEWTARAVLGTGFRAPSLYELFGPYGNSGLKEETSQSAEFGLERRFGDLGFVKGTLFYTEIDDRIDWEGLGYNQVEGTTVSKGLELSGQYALSDAISLFGNYTYTSAKTEDARAARVPRHDLVVGVDAVLSDRINGQLMVQHVADVLDGSEKLDDYTLFNASLSYDLTDKVQLYLRADNLTDEDYETVSGYNTPGRSAYLGLKASF
ncbi:TonB-dependent receptor domain-containing protein [uncultured Celeribacter sp.]|uniref:TonB-dependent receptor plug domain-containing protein n=1 Tax=uncultured Celeribacter sp. TaxID=1303376 RepID=UPI002AA95005|nr:TonB-dependent receptor [uncultured Celeribacter sp.]